MKSMTIHGLDDATSQRLEEEAKRRGVSLNRTIKRILTDTLGTTGHGGPDHRGDFLDLFGRWTATQQKELDGAVRRLRRIDESDWR